MMLWRGGSFPVTFHKKDMVVVNQAEYHLDDFDAQDYSNDFNIQNKSHVYMLSLKRWQNHPHFAKMFYHTKRKRLILAAMTHRGYDKLITVLNKTGYNFPLQPDHRATPGIEPDVAEQVAGQVLNKFSGLGNAPNR
ncbi:MAG: hypothetical protein ABIA63_03015 [bacterium]